MVCLSGETPMLEEDDTVLKPCSNLATGTCVCPDDATLSEKSRVPNRLVCHLCRTRFKRLRYAAQETKNRDPDH